MTAFIMSRLGDQRMCGIRWYQSCQCQVESAVICHIYVHCQPPFSLPYLTRNYLTLSKSTLLWSGVFDVYCIICIWVIAGVCNCHIIGMLREEHTFITCKGQIMCSGRDIYIDPSTKINENGIFNFPTIFEGWVNNIYFQFL